MRPSTAHISELNGLAVLTTVLRIATASLLLGMTAAWSSAAVLPSKLDALKLDEHLVAAHHREGPGVVVAGELRIATIIAISA